MVVEDVAFATTFKGPNDGTVNKNPFMLYFQTRERLFIITDE